MSGHNQELACEQALVGLSEVEDNIHNDQIGSYLLWAHSEYSITITAKYSFALYVHKNTQTSCNRRYANILVRMTQAYFRQILLGLSN